MSEAIVLGVPVLSTRISGSVGMLGEDYPGYFPVGDTKALADLIVRAENDAGFLQSLKQRVESLSPRFKPEAEKASLERLLNEFQ